MIGFMFDLFKKQDEVATGRNIKEMDLSPLDSAVRPRASRDGFACRRLVSFGMLRIGLRTDLSFRLINKLVLVVLVAQRAKTGLGEVPDLMALGSPYSSNEVGLIVTVEVNFVGPITHLFALQQLIGDRRIAGGGDQRRKPVKARHYSVGEKQIGRMVPVGDE
jgi:hypothetical protein